MACVSFSNAAMTSASFLITNVLEIPEILSDDETKTILMAIKLHRLKIITVVNNVHILWTTALIDKFAYTTC